MSEVDPTPQEPDLDQQLGEEIEPVEEQDQTDVPEGDEDERLADLEQRQNDIEEKIDALGQSFTQEPLNAVFPARFDTNGNFQELCVVNSTLADMTGGRSSSGWTGIPLGSGQGFVVECEDYDASNSRSKMQFLLLGAGTSSTNLVPVGVSQDNGAGHAGDTANQCSFTYTVTLDGGTLGTGVTPAMQRPALGKQVAAHIGIWKVSSGQLWWCDEVDAVTPRVCP